MRELWNCIAIAKFHTLISRLRELNNHLMHIISWILKPICQTQSSTLYRSPWTSMMGGAMTLLCQKNHRINHLSYSNITMIWLRLSVFLKNVTAWSGFSDIWLSYTRRFLLYLLISEIRSQETFMRWYYNIRHGADMIFGHSDVTLRLSSFAV